MKTFAKMLALHCGVAALLSGVMLSQDQIQKTYFSPSEWSGEGKQWSNWYTFTTPPAPAGYTLVDVKFELQGDRLCHSWGECQEVKRQSNGSVVLRFRMQGHDENIHPELTKIDKNGFTFKLFGRKATSRLAVTLTYKKS